jgi:hypothetical protein
MAEVELNVKQSAMAEEVKLDLKDHAGKMKNRAGAGMDSSSRLSK